MLRIRLRRVGKKGKPSYRIVVAEAKAPRDGAYVEWIGNYDPMIDPPAVTIKADRALEWLGKGAQPSDAVRRILDWNGILPRTPTQRKATTSTPAEATAEPTVAVQTQPAATPPQDVSEDVAEEVVDEVASEEPTEEALAEETTGEAPEDTSEEAPEDTSDDAPEATSTEAPEE